MSRPKELLSPSTEMSTAHKVFAHSFVLDRRAQAPGTFLPRRALAAMSVKAWHGSNRGPT